MSKVKSAVAITAAGILAAQPSVTAAQTAGVDERRTSAFAGLNVRMELGGAKPAKPFARMQLTSSYHVRDARTGSLQTLKAQGLEFGAAQNGAPTFYLNGQSTSQLKERNQLSGSTPDAVWIGLSVALVVVGVMVISNLDGLNE